MVRISIQSRDSQESWFIRGAQHITHTYFKSRIIRGCQVAQVVLGRSVSASFLLYQRRSLRTRTGARVGVANCKMLLPTLRTSKRCVIYTDTPNSPLPAHQGLHNLGQNTAAHPPRPLRPPTPYPPFFGLLEFSESAQAQARFSTPAPAADVIHVACPRL